MPIPLCVQGQIAVGCEASWEIITDAVRRICIRHLLQRRRDIWGYVVEENQVDCVGEGAVGGEGGVGLEVLGLGVVWDFGVDRVVAIGAEIICR